MFNCRASTWQSFESIGSRRTSERVRDEVYRQMIRFEAQHPDAELKLALALLHAWMALDRPLMEGDQYQWLRKICPVCLAMIETVHRGQASCKQTDEVNGE